MLKIKLARFGKKHQPHYRVVVNEARDRRDGKYVALVGHYAPVTEELEIDVKAFEEWVKKGAQPTETVMAIFERFKSGNPFPAKKAKPSKKALAKAAEAAKQAAEPAAPVEEPKAEEAAVEAPVEEKPAETEEKTEENQAPEAAEPAAPVEA